MATAFSRLRTLVSRLTGRPLWPFNPEREAEDFTNPEDYIEQIRAVIDAHGFDIQVFFVAASGFLTDSYNLFASNVILPCLTFVYWNTCGQTKEIWINIATLAGSAAGQLIFGLLADIYGRRSLYGIELYIVIFSTLLIAQASDGFREIGGDGETSMSIFAMLLAWRFIMGIGIGAEYPLSACITAEWAATRERGRMLSAVFLMQPLGQLLAWSVGLAALEILSHDHDFSTDSDDAKIGIDKLWRWVIGLGAVPAALAIRFRLTIPESGRYTYDVRKDGPLALQDTIGVFYTHSTRTSHSRLPANAISAVEMGEYHAADARPDASAPAVLQSVAIPPQHLAQAERTVSASRATSDPDIALPVAAWDDVVLEPQGNGLGHSASSDSSEIHNASSQPRSNSMPAVARASTPTPSPLQPYSDTVQGPSPLHTPVMEPPTVQFADHAYDSDDGHSDEESNDPNQLQDKRLSKQKNQFERSQLYEYFWEEGNWRYLAGTSITWFLLDFAFYGLGFNNPGTMAKIWTDGPMPTCDDIQPNQAYLTVSSVGKGGNIYQVLWSNARQSLLTVSIASCLGSIAMIMAINHVDRRVMLVWTFIALAILLLITGVAFLEVFHTKAYAATIVLYAFNQLIFSFGPNTLTFIIPAEIWPTRYRCTCHGIAAACGKLGAVVVQFVFLGYNARQLSAPNSKALGKVIVIFAAFMVLGAVFSSAWIPAVQQKSEDARFLLDNIDLETLAKGEERLPKDEKVGFRNRLRRLKPRKGAWHRKSCNTSATAVE